MRIYMPRFFVRDLDTNLAVLQQCVDAAASAECDGLVFPEQFLTGYCGENDLPRIRAAFAAASASHPEMLMVFGTISEDGVNRLCIYLAGREVVHYDKIHLFLPNGEGDIWGIGDRYVALRHGRWRIGLATCNDVRFPEQARALKLKHNINMLIYPALWPWQRDHVWAALLRARAIENGCFVIGCCVAGVDIGDEQFDGAGNHVFNPVGDEIYPADRVYPIEFSLLDEVVVDTREQFCPIDKVDLV